MPQGAGRGIRRQPVCPSRSIPVASRRRSPINYRLPNTQRFGNSFCRICGSPMPRAVPTRDVVLIPAGVLDDDPKVRTNYHIYVGSNAPWHEITDNLPQYPEGPPLR
ncbi:MAG: GFA family protein [Steroidobacteraceae bacterium]